MDSRRDIRPESTFGIVGAAIKVHRALGPGLLESVYRACLVQQLRSDGHRTRTEVPVPIAYEGMRIEAAYRADLIVDDEVLLELKAVAQLLPIHSVQLTTYLKLAQLPIGLLINFNVPQLRQGVRRFINGDLCTQPIDEWTPPSAPLSR
jgi:GxxExxY protein